MKVKTHHFYYLAALLFAIAAVLNFINSEDAVVAPAMMAVAALAFLLLGVNYHKRNKIV